MFIFLYVTCYIRRTRGLTAVRCPVVRCRRRVPHLYVSGSFFSFEKTSWPSWALLCHQLFSLDRTSAAPRGLKRVFIMGNAPWRSEVSADLFARVFIYWALKRRWQRGTTALTSGMNHDVSELYCCMAGRFPLSNGLDSHPATTHILPPPSPLALSLSLSLRGILFLLLHSGQRLQNSTLSENMKLFYPGVKGKIIS